jgi:tetratricopeptide (TPR) repeat protein
VTVTLAHHFVQAGESDRAIEYLRRAGEQAADRSAFNYAEGFLFDALARVEDQPNSRDKDRSELQIRMALGPTLVATRGWFGEEVLENYQRAMELCESGDPCSEAALARYGLATVTELRGEYPRTEQLLLPLLGDTTDDLGMEARELMACSMFHQGAFQRSVDNARTVLDSWEQDDYSVLMSRLAEHPASACNSWASLSSWYLGRSDESLQLAAAAVQIGEQNLYALSTARVQCAFLHQFRDEPALCGDWADQAMELADHQGFPMRALQATIIRGWVDAAEGSPDEGVARIAIGLDRYRSLRARLTEPYFIGLHAEAELFAGRPDHALRLLDEAVLNMNETTRSFFFDPELHRLRARAHSQIGGQDAVTAAREALDQASTGAELLRSPPLALRAAIDRLRLEAQHGDPEPWREPVALGIAHYEGQTDTVDVVAARSLLDA